jgi:tRNA pseudouridine55 synthase
VAVESGILLFDDKPKGVTSHDIVDRVRRERGGKVGHAGTLDPLRDRPADHPDRPGNEAPALFHGPEKTYVARAKLGWTSTTGDP